MYKDKRILAIIPARGGSKGIPNKNVIDINGKPLIQYTIDEAKKSSYLDKIIVSTDSQQIATISKNLGAEVPFLRPSELANDSAKTIDTMLHVIQKLEMQSDIYDYVVLLQPTQPLRKHWHVDEAIETIIRENGEGLVSVSKVKEHPILMRTIKNKNFLNNLLSENSTMRRQDFPDFYKVNGAVYINRINSNFSQETSLNDNKIPYVMDLKFDLDIDDFDDLNKARRIL